MRTIKFRGKRLDNGEWLYGNLVEMHNPFKQEDDPIFFIMPKEVSIADPDSIAEQEVVDPHTVGQFTGLLDNNGKEIYEGDVVDFMAYDAIGNERDKEQGIVRFAFCGYQIGGYDMYNVLLNDEDAEVIGNIHDHQELMKKNE